MKSDHILSTIEMIQKENLDVRTVTMGINLLDCKMGTVNETCEKINKKVLNHASKFVETCNKISRTIEIPVVNNRISSTHIAHVGTRIQRDRFVNLTENMTKTT